MVASLKMIFRCLILQGIGMTCLALLGLNTEAHGLQDPAAHITEGTLPAVDQAEFKSVIAINPPTEPKEQQHVKPKKHGIIPRTPAGRKSELRWLKVDEDQLRFYINLLDPQPNTESAEIQTQLQNLLDAFKIPIIHRIYRLNLLDPTFDVLRPKSTVMTPDSQPAPHASEKRVSRLSDWILDTIENIKDATQFDKLTRSSHNTDRQAKTESGAPLTIAAPLVSGDNSHGPTRVRISPEKDFLTNVPVVSYQGETPPSDLTALRAITKEKNQNQNAPSASTNRKLDHSPPPIESPPSLGSVSIEPAMDQKPRRDQTLTAGSVKPGHGGELARSAEILDERLVGKLIPSEDLSAKLNSMDGALQGDPLHFIKDIIVDERIEIWNSLQGKLITLQSPSSGPDAAEQAKFPSLFLETSYLMGDFIFRHGMLPSHFIDNIEIFKRRTLVKMVELHIDLMFLRWGKKWFDNADAVIPQIGFLKTSPAVYHFRRSIAELPVIDQKYVVFAALKSIISHTQGNSPTDTGRPSSAFGRLREEFLRVNFLEEAEILSSAISKGPDVNHHHQDENLPIVRLIENLIDSFQNPPPYPVPGKPRLEFLNVYFVLDFLQQYYRPIIEAMGHGWQTPSLFQTQHKFMRGWLEYHRNPNVDPSCLPGEDRYTVFDIVSRAERNDVLLHEWIGIVTSKIFNHGSWRRSRGAPDFNIWMGQDPRYL
ncbi:hypothetical protein MJO28_017885 [Puccinia striiformis f. sp. tritici]|nr:hypothetical protein MJO28_017885 [Puccinia striiformis f. sp. tritici]